MIYHYCDEYAFRQILETKILWLSDITMMNDKNEYKTGFRIILDILKEYPDLDKKVSTEMSPDNINRTFKVLIVCFSRNGDLLSQWRAYADDGKGLSIGFDMELIKRNNMFNRYLERMEPISSKIEFISVNYDQATFEKEVHDQIRAYKDSSSPIKFKLLARVLMYLAIRYKNDFFSEENEVRGFIAPEDDIKNDDFEVETRDCSYGVTYYHKLLTSFQNIHAINEVIIGPKCNYTAEDVDGLLKSTGLEHVTVKYSSGTGRYR
ncbi:DUF2971 domain-containing protein [Vibrio parahaemolyticus]|uniref:DUF2971 domain-containing protein n=1 Tax=Vibrio parahaemolyticus TaxID=670 RepID=UPI002361DE39|nr:DUF2971 domain-containing protein [Vibrio parahaemolyticus]EKO3802475.1 DUF2971 domain-containing protein [Vibrio harveyi]ELA9340479.1 DUF2971 domain-containing protein [Vibrio parahaemolyticus]MDF5575881.1 DUF2971 domain-containing protein [Vibrio parahaemolyticus]MDG2903502.1 DUF2971 domain-containing protein [Vibrio parahaemolyticus]